VFLEHSDFTYISFMWEFQNTTRTQSSWNSGTVFQVQLSSQTAVFDGFAAALVELQHFFMRAPSFILGKKQSR